MGSPNEHRVLPKRPADPPKMRDLPAPRSVKGAIAPTFRVIFAWPYRFGLSSLYRAGFLPWHLTLLSLIANAIAGWLLLTGQRFLPAMFLIPAGLFDIFDGSVARLRGEDSRSGAFLDSVLDRVADVVVFGCLFWSLAGQGERLGAALALASLIASFLVSYVRAQAEAMQLSLTEGFVQRLERYVLLLIGLVVPGALIPVLAFLAALGVLTAMQRGVSAWRKLTTNERGPD